MSKLFLYSVFHANLNFSYIAKDLYPQVLERCYWPLLRIIEERQVPLGLEFSAYTLEVVNSLDPSFVERLGRLWQDGLCEVIGSGYTQSVMPLIPAKVNRKNLCLGNSVYEQLLGQRPKTALVNELVYSGGLPSLYQEAGYENLIVNWDSAAAAQSNQELLYRPCNLPVGESGTMPVVWQSLLAYRNFQRHVEGEITQDEFMERLLSHMPAEGERAYPLYCSDWEVFDFKPWRVYPEGFKRPESDEMSKVASLLDRLAAIDDIEIVTPSALVKLLPPKDTVVPESAEHPLPYKKQALHSVGRWAVGGRSAVQNNTLCYRLYQQLSQADWQMEQAKESAGSKAEATELWNELCFLWNSDFRTFTTEEKHQEFQRRMGSALERAERLLDSLASTILENDQVWLTNSTPVAASTEPASLTVYTNGNSPAAPAAYQLEIEGQTVACQVAFESVVNQGLKKLTLETLPILKPYQSVIGAVKTTPVSHDHSKDWDIDRENNRVVTPSVVMDLLPKWGGTLDSLTFPNVSAEALIRRGQETTPDPAWTTDNLFAGDLVLRDQQGRTITDHQPTEIEYPDPAQSHEIFIPVRCSVQTALGTIWKTYRVYIHQPRVDLMIRFQWRDAVPRYFRLGTMPLNTPAWDRSSLYYATTNGGDDVERFPLAGRFVAHGAAMPGDVTSRCCLGATEAWTVLGDAEKGIGFVTRPGELYSVPMVSYEESPTDPESFLLSLTHTLGEWDETSHNLWRGHSTWTMSVLAGKKGIIDITRSCALLSNGGLTVRSGKA